MNGKHIRSNGRCRRVPARDIRATVKQIAAQINPEVV